MNNTLIKTNTKKYPNIWTETTLGDGTALFPGPPTIQFWSLAVCKIEGRRPGPFFHGKDVSVYWGEQRGGGVPNRKNAFCTCILCLEQGAVCFSFCKHSKLQRLGQKLQERPQALMLVLSVGDPPLSTWVDIDVIYMIKWTRSPPLHTASNQ